LVRIENTLYSRIDLEVEEFTVREIELKRSGLVEGRVRFWDGSLFQFAESISVIGVSLVKQRHVYHYQDLEFRMRFRYDNVPHHPEVASHPHHKHVGQPKSGKDRIVACLPPDLSAVLREIDELLRNPA
jgi:hypothetical protein